MILGSVEIHTAIRFILSYKYYSRYNRIIEDDHVVTNYRQIFDDLDKQEISNIALIPSSKIDEGFLSRIFVPYDLSGSPAIEVIKGKRSDYYSLDFLPGQDKYALVKMHTDHKRSSIRTDREKDNKIILLINYLYKSSLIKDNPDNYERFFKYAMNSLEEPAPVFYIPEYTEFITADKLRILFAILTASGFRSMEMHNGLEGMKMLPLDQLGFRIYDKRDHFSLLLHLSNQFLYDLFR